MTIKKIKAVTTFSQDYWNATAQYTVKNWPIKKPKDWEIWLHDSPKDYIEADNYIEQKEKNNWIENAKIESQKYPLPPGYMSEWHKFCHKSFAQWETYEADPQGIMVWFDSDVVWKEIPTTDIVIKSLNGKFCGYFGRDRVDTTKVKKQYPKLNIEACYIAYDLDHPVAQKFFNTFKNIYTSMELFNLYDWCDTGVFEEAMIRTGKDYFNDITGHLPPALAPLPISFLDQYFEHWMGSKNKELKKDASGLKEKFKMQKRGLI